MSSDKKSRFSSIVDEATAARVRPQAAPPASVVASSPSVQPGRALRMIAPANIRPNPSQPRQRFDEGSLQELAQSLREHGLIQPIIVRPTEVPAVFELVAGERRWRAAQLAELAEIPAVVDDALTDELLFERALVENIQREDLNPLEEGTAFASLMELRQLRYEDVARLLGKSVGYVQNRVRCTQVAQDLQQLVLDRPDALSHIYYLDKVADPLLRAQLIAAVKANKLSLADLRSHVQDLVVAQASTQTRDEALPRAQPAAVQFSGIPLASPVLARAMKQTDATFKRWRAEATLLAHEDRQALLQYLSELIPEMEVIITSLGASTEMKSEA